MGAKEHEPLAELFLFGGRELFGFSLQDASGLGHVWLDGNQLDSEVSKKGQERNLSSRTYRNGSRRRYQGDQSVYWSVLMDDLSMFRQSGGCYRRLGVDNRVKDQTRDEEMLGGRLEETRSLFKSYTSTLELDGQS